MPRPVGSLYRNFMYFEMRRVYLDRILIQHFPKALDPDSDVKIVLLLRKNVKRIIFEDFY